MDIAPALTGVPGADSQQPDGDTTVEFAPVPSPAKPGGHRSRLGRERRWWWLDRERRWWPAGAALVLVAAAGGTAWAVSGSTSTGPKYRPVAASTGTMRLTTSASGTLQPAQQSSQSFQVSGQVASVAVTLGQQVTAGQTLATVNSATQAAQAAQAAQANATLANDRAKLSADQAAGASSAQLAADQAAVGAAQSALTNAQASLADDTLTSPIAGTVAQLNLTVGQQVAASGGSGSGSGGSGSGSGGSGSGSGGSGSSGGGSGGSGAGGAGSSSGSAAGGSGTAGTGSSGTASSAQVVVVGPAFVVNVAVDDTQIGSIADGEQAVIVPQGTNTPVYGTVTSVGLLASSSSGVASFPVVITVTGTPTGLYAGATTSVAIVVKQLTNVLEVPAAAVHYTGGKATVLEDRAGRTVGVPVTVGLSSGGYTQITAGITAGQQVLVPAAATPRSTGSTGRAGGTGARTGGAGGAGGGFGGGGLGAGRSGSGS